MSSEPPVGGRTPRSYIALGASGAACIIAIRPPEAMMLSLNEYYAQEVCIGLPCLVVQLCNLSTLWAIRLPRQAC